MTLPDYRSRQAELKSSGIIDFENKNISVVTKHWKYKISVSMLYIAFNTKFIFFYIALNRVLTLADYRSRQAELKSSGIIDFENKNISVVTKH